jgi:hypothetical protein
MNARQAVDHFVLTTATVSNRGASIHRRVVGSLLRPQLVPVYDDPDDVNPTACHMDKEQPVVDTEPPSVTSSAGKKPVCAGA